MSNVEIRPVLEHELSEATNVDLLAQGRGDIVASRPPGHVSRVVRHLFETGIAMAAFNETGAMIGSGASLKRDGTLVLAQLFVLPNRQSSGVGGRLLEAVMPPGPEARATVASSDPRAVALYMRAGMLPRWPHFDLEASSASLRDLPETGITIVEDSGIDEEFAAWDAEMSGRQRPEEHRYLLGHLSGTALWFERGGVRIGYGYAGRAGDTILLGPIGCRDESDARDCVLAAVRWATGHASEIGIELSGLHAALKPLIDAGMHIHDLQTFMASDPTRFGDPRRYVPTGAPFF